MDSDSSFITIGNSFSDIERTLMDWDDINYTLGSIQVSHRNPNTRFVIFEKYPEKIKHEFEDTEIEGVKTAKMYIDFELIPTKKSICVDFTISPNGDIEFE
jgi:hypothetical protein